MKPIAIAGLILAMALAAADDKKAAVLMQAAQAKETVQGDLKGAIDLYGQANREAATNRALAAMALVRMAECYQKMGDAESGNIFERVLRDYSDQKEAVAEAQARLGRNAPRNGVVSRQVWTGPKVDVYGSVSRDGKYLSFVDWQNGGNLALHDLVNGSDRLITKDGETEYSTISRDGKLVAYEFFKHDVWRYEVRLANLTGAPNPRRLFDSEEVGEISPYDWSPDGRWIAVGVRRNDHTAQLGLISTRDGSLTVLKSVDWRGSTRMFFSPDGKFVAYDLPAGDSADQRDVLVMAIDGSREIPAVKDPNRNMVMGWSPDGALLFASDRSGSMGLYMLPFRDGTPLGPPRFLKADIGAFESSVGVTDSGALYFGRTGQSANIEIVPVDWAAGKIPAGLRPSPVIM